MAQKNLRHLRGHKFGSNEDRGIIQRDNAKNGSINQGQPIGRVIIEDAKMRVNLEGKIFIYQKDLPLFNKELNEFLDKWEV